MTTTTRQAEALNLALASPPTSYRGLIVGSDVMSGQLVTHDPFMAYEDKLVSSVNAVVIGDIGKGKSSLLKTWACLRQLLVNDRRVVVLDKKLQGGRGEYTRLARFLGAPSIRLTLDGRGSRINLLDPVITMGSDQRGDIDGADRARPTGQMMLLRAVLAEALGRAVSEREGKALRLALVAATRDARNRDRVPVIGDIVHHLQHPDDDDARELNREVRDLQEWGMDPAFALERMIDEDLAGLVDAETSADVHLDHPSGFTHFDVSGLPTDGPAVRLVMKVINAWQTNMLAKRSEQRQQTVTIIEEGWHLTDGPGGDIAKHNGKLSRGLGLAQVIGFHHVSDMTRDSPARSVIQEAETVFIYGQAKLDDALTCVELFGLPPGTENTIAALDQGVCLLKVGSQDPILVRHQRSPRELALTDTDDALTAVIDRAP